MGFKQEKFESFIEVKAPVFQYMTVQDKISLKVVVYE